jgi:hypothetical protein
LWKIPTGDNSAAGGHYNWSSPLIVGNFAYVGIASLGDCPLVQGQLLKVDLTAHAIAATLNLVSNGFQGGGIWTSPAYDPGLGRIFTTTGTETSDAETYAQAVLGIDPTNMTVVDSWHLPENQAVADSDWTTSTMLYTDSGGRNLLVATNKNGFTYAFLRSNLAAGPVWSQQVAIGTECAACGNSTVSSAALGAGQIYQAGGTTTVGGVGYAGQVQALNPSTGAIIWQHPEAGPVIGAVTYMNGMVIVGAGSGVELLEATTGHRLYSYDTGPGNLIFAAPAVADGTIIIGNTSGTILAFGLPATLPAPPPPDPNCPTGFTCQDIGSPSPAGSETVTSGAWSTTVGGAGIAGTSDSFRLASEPAAGDVQITARVTGLTGGSSTAAQAGLMVRQDNTPGSPYYGIFLTPTSVVVSYRNVFDGTTTTANAITRGSLPKLLEIQRQGDVLTAATSTDGVTYTMLPGVTATVLMPYAALVGLATSSTLQGTAATANFDTVTIGGLTNTPVNTPSSGACPSGWNCSDIGDPLTIGNQSLAATTWTLAGSGRGVDGRTDQFHYVWQTASGDSTLTTRITSQTNTNGQAKAGAMMRADASANAAFYGAFVTPTNGIEIVDRSIKGLPSNQLLQFGGAVPAYLQIQRSGTTFTTLTSADGANWTPVVGSTINLPNLSGTILDGDAVTSTNTGATSTATAEVLDVATGAPAPPTNCPTNFTCQDIGSPIPAGSNYLIGGTWSLLGGGKDIWGSFDEFHMVSEPMAGDGVV